MGAAALKAERPPAIERLANDPSAAWAARKIIKVPPHYPSTWPSAVLPVYVGAAAVT